MSMSKTRETNCGCGRAGACGCSSATCSSTGAGAAETYVRPNFFAGQLLTEDDLDRLVEYTTAKLRLRNRNLFGAGVVCGLEVGCHACGGGQVIVHPGHALDCCGNDIVVPCPEQLDINAMLHELQTKLRGGWNCGDPCAREQPSTPATDKPPRAMRGRVPIDRGQSYGLWIVYDEQPFDLQTPYETDEPCSSLACEPTRIRETYRFELRCPEPEPKPVDVLSRALACLTEFVSSRRDVTVGRALHVKAMHMQAAQAVIATNPDTHWKIVDIEAYQADLQQADDAFVVHTSNLEKKIESEPHTVIRDLERLAGIRLRWQFQPEDYQGDELYELLDEARAHVLFGAEQFGPAWQETHFAVGIERHQARAVTDAIAKFYPGPDEDEFASPAELRASDEARMLVEQVASTATLHNRHAEALAELRNALRRVLGRRRLITDCTLASDLDRLQLPIAVAGPDVTDIEIADFVLAALGLGELILRWLRECICGALQPPCSTCDDDGVLLATVRVDDCEVLEICNLERRWVLTSTNVRYWLPPLRLLGDLLEQVCCALPAKLQFGRAGSEDMIADGKRPAEGRPFKYVPMAEPKPDEWLAALLEEIGETWVGQPIAWAELRGLVEEIAILVRSRTGRLEREIGERPTAYDRPDLRALIAPMLDERLGEIDVVELRRELDLANKSIRSMRSKLAALENPKKTAKTKTKKKAGR